MFYLFGERIISPSGPQVKHGKDAFLLLITDGINFVLRSEEACNIINHAEDPYQAAVVLTEQVGVCMHV